MVRRCGGCAWCVAVLERVPKKYPLSFMRPLQLSRYLLQCILMDLRTCKHRNTFIRVTTYKNFSFRSITPLHPCLSLPTATEHIQDTENRPLHLCRCLHLQSKERVVASRAYHLIIKVLSRGKIRWASLLLITTTR